MLNIYEEMINAGVQIDHHESDLYVPVNDVTTAIIARYDYKDNVTKFRSSIEPHDMWYDIPFAYQPYWDKKRADRTKLTGF